jgi:hypothetical protein
MALKLKKQFEPATGALLRPSTVAKLLGYKSAITIVRKIREGKIQGVNVSQGKRATWRVFQSEVDRLIAAGRSEE